MKLNAFKKSKGGALEVVWARRLSPVPAAMLMLACESTSRQAKLGNSDRITFQISLCPRATSTANGNETGEGLGNGNQSPEVKLGST